MASNAEAIFLDAGEAALVVEFGRTIEPAVHNRVLAIGRASCRERVYLCV